MSTTLEARICGIPCQIEVTYFKRGAAAKLSGHPDSWDEGEGTELEYNVLDRRGRKASWLDRKLTESEVERDRLEEFLMDNLR